MQGGTRAELDLGALLGKRGTIYATSLRSRPLAEKASICRSVVEGLWPLIARRPGAARSSGRRTRWTRSREAHTLVADSGHVGKVLLTVP